VNAPRPGDVFVENLTGLKHYVIVVSDERYNRGLYLTVVWVTDAKLEKRWNEPSCVPFRRGQFMFTKDCVAHGETLMQIRKKNLDDRKGLVGRIDDATMRDLIRAIGVVISAECEPAAFVG